MKLKLPRLTLVCIFLLIKFFFYPSPVVTYIVITVVLTTKFWYFITFCLLILPDGLATVDV